MHALVYLLFTKAAAMRPELRFGLVLPVVLLLILISPLTPYAQYYKCIAEDGVHIYTNTGCPIGTENQRFVIPESEQTESSETHVSDASPQRDHEYPFNGYKNGGGVNLEIFTEGYRLTQKERYRVEAGINFILGYYKQVFNYSEDVPVKIRIFGKKARFMSYQEGISPLVSEIGFYSPLYKEAVINGDRSKYEVIATIYHEANHAILTQKAPDLPLWINEGLAEYFERIVPKQDSVTIGHQDSRYLNLMHNLRADELPALSSYLSLWDGAWERNAQAQDEDARSIAWSVVHYLMSTREGQETVIEILREKNGNPSISSIDIINRNYPGGLDELEENWRKYLKQSPTLHVYEPFE